MNNTTHYELKKPEATDFYNIDDFNDNADLIDTLIYEHGEGAEQESSPAGTDFLQLIGGSDSKLYKALISDIADTVLRKLAISTSETGLASGSVIEKINSLNGNFGGFKFHYLSQNVSIPANSYLEIDISSISNSPFIMSAFLGHYMLPYSEGGVVKTWVYTVSEGKIRIQNNTTAWTNFAFSAAIASR